MKVLKRLLPVCALFLMSAPATAAGGYFGLAIGQATLGDWDESAIDDGSLTSASAEDTDTSIRIMGGYEMNPNVAFEVGYSDFGEATADGNSDGSVFWTAGPVSGKSSADGIDFGALGRFPVSESFLLHGRLGLLMWDGEGTFGDSTGSISASDDGTDLFFGIGGEFRTKGAFAVRLEYTSYSLDDVDLDSLALSLIYRMGS